MGGKRAGWPPDTNWILYARTTCKHGVTVNYRGCWWGRKRTMAKIQARSSTAKQINQIQDKAYVVQKQVQQQHFQKLKVRSIAASAWVSFSLTTHCVLGSAVLFVCIWGISKPSHWVCANLTHLITTFKAGKVDLLSLNARIPIQSNANVSLPVKHDGSVSAGLKSNVFSLRGRVFTAALCWNQNRRIFIVAPPEITLHTPFV